MIGDSRNTSRTPKLGLSALVDHHPPQIYRRDFESYNDLSIGSSPSSSPLSTETCSGILLKLGSYRISPEYLLQVIKYNRYRGIQGEVFFFYEGLREDNDALAKVLRSPTLMPARSGIGSKHGVCIQSSSYYSRQCSQILFLLHWIKSKRAKL